MNAPFEITGVYWSSPDVQKVVEMFGWRYDQKCKEVAELIDMNKTKDEKIAELIDMNKTKDEKIAELIDMNKTKDEKITWLEESSAA